MELTILWGMATITIFAMFVLITLVAVKATNRINETNKQLMVMVAHRDGGDNAARALIASAKPPQTGIPGISKEKKSKKELEAEANLKDRRNEITVGFN